jgi:myo-inositol-hexaphosphate 3-phosphohydrolase
MSETVGKEVISREKGFLYCVKADGYVWKVPTKPNKTGKAAKVGKEQIKKEPGFLYFLGSDGRVGRSPMKNAPKKK